MTDPTLEPDDAAATLKRIWPFLVVAYPGYEAAVEKVRAYFQHEGLTYSPYAFCGLVRCHLHDFISAPQWVKRGFKIIRLPNDGIDVEYRGCRIKAWKGTDELPVPRSTSKADYCYQPSLFPLGRQGAPLRKLVITWELNDDLSLKRLSLICPKWDGTDTDVHWSQEIPHPLTMMSAGQEFGSSSDLDEPGEPQTGIEGQ